MPKKLAQKTITIKQLDSVKKGTIDQLINHRLKNIDKKEKAKVREEAKKGAALMIELDKFHNKSHDIKDSTESTKNEIEIKPQEQIKEIDKKEENAKSNDYSYVGNALTAGIMHSFVVSNSDIKSVMQYVFSTGATEYLREMMQIIKEKDKELADKMAKIQAAYVQEEFIQEEFIQQIAQEEDPCQRTTAISDGILTILEAGDFMIEKGGNLIAAVALTDPDIVHGLLHGTSEELLKFHENKKLGSDEKQNSSVKNNEIKDGLQGIISSLGTPHNLKDEQKKILEKPCKLLAEHIIKNLRTEQEIHDCIKMLSNVAKEVKAAKKSHEHFKNKQQGSRQIM